MVGFVREIRDCNDYGLSGHLVIANSSNRHTVCLSAPDSVTTSGRISVKPRDRTQLFSTNLMSANQRICPLKETALI